MHEEYINHVGSGLAMSNHLIDVVGSGTYQASSSTIADFQAANNVKEALAHECDKASFQPCNRYAFSLNQMGIYSNTDIAASNTTSTWEARFTAQDGSFPAGYRGSRARGC